MRRYLLARAGLPNARRVLEVGCGSGAILVDLAMPSSANLFGLDIDQSSLQIAKKETPTARLTAGDAHRLPYPGGKFDIVFTHFVLLWLQQPTAALQEMRRVTRRGGTVLALAEPDYGKRVDQPEGLAKLGRLQTESLRAQGADPQIGGRLQGLFEAAGFGQIEGGQIATEKNIRPSKDDWRLETEMLRADLAGMVSPEELEKLLEEDQRAWQAGTRVLQVPTYYALGQVI